MYNCTSCTIWADDGILNKIATALDTKLGVFMVFHVVHLYNTDTRFEAHMLKELPATFQSKVHIEQPIHMRPT